MPQYWIVPRDSLIRHRFMIAAVFQRQGEFYRLLSKGGVSYSQLAYLIAQVLLARHRIWSGRGRLLNECRSFRGKFDARNLRRYYQRCE